MGKKIIWMEPAWITIFSTLIWINLMPIKKHVWKWHSGNYTKALTHKYHSNSPISDYNMILAHISFSKILFMISIQIHFLTYSKILKRTVVTFYNWAQNTSKHAYLIGGHDRQDVIRLLFLFNSNQCVHLLRFSNLQGSSDLLLIAPILHWWTTHWGKKQLFIQKLSRIWCLKNVNFVKNESLKMWIMWKMRLWNCEFCEE